MTKKIIGLYQLITGVFGVILILFTAFTKEGNPFKSQEFIVQLIVGVLFFGLLAWSGYGLLNSIRNAKRYSMLLQTLQIPYVAITGILYKFTAAGFLSAGFINGKFDFQLSLQPINFALHSNPSNESVFYIYLIPILLLYGLSKVR